jgi:superfamily I DNA/RNA helicase
MLATNYRCPAAVIEASARMVAANAERFAKPIRPPAGRRPTADDLVSVDARDPGWTDAAAAHAAAEAAAGRSVCFLSRTRGELMPILLALVRAGVPHATSIPLPADAEPVIAVVDALRGDGRDDRAYCFLRDLRAERGLSRGDPRADALNEADVAALDALLGWSIGFDDAATFVAAFDDARARLADLRDPAALVELATVHGSKGREWETVVLIGFEVDRIPNRRALVDAADPGRALEEERRLAYVALTRATRRLILAFDPDRPSPFLAEMGLRAP